MATKIFVNLPVRNLKRSVEFFTQLGFTFNPQFTDENATCMIVGEDMFGRAVDANRLICGRAKGRNLAKVSPEWDAARRGRVSR